MWEGTPPTPTPSHSLYLTLGSWAELTLYKQSHRRLCLPISPARKPSCCGGAFQVPKCKDSQKTLTSEQENNPPVLWYGSYAPLSLFFFLGGFRCQHNHTLSTNKKGYRWGKIFMMSSVLLIVFTPFVSPDHDCPPRQLSSADEKMQM